MTRWPVPTVEFGIKVTVSGGEARASACKITIIDDNNNAAAAVAAGVIRLWVHKNLFYYSLICVPSVGN